MPDEELEGKGVFCNHCVSSSEELPLELRPVRRGTCPWCGARNQPLYPMHAIADRVRELADLYPTALDFEDEPHEPRLLSYFQDTLGENLFRGNFWEHFILPDGPPVSWYDAFLEDMTIEIPQDQALYRARVWDRNLEDPAYSWIEDISIRYSDAEPFEAEHPYLYEYWRSHP